MTPPLPVRFDVDVAPDTVRTALPELRMAVEFGATAPLGVEEIPADGGTTPPPPVPFAVAVSPDTVSNPVP